MPSLTLAMTIGDPMGIGPEITAKFLAWHSQRFSQYGFRVYGSQTALQHVAKQLGLTLPREAVCYIDTEAEMPGKTAYLAIEHAVEDIVSGKAHALVTGPIAKHHLQVAGILASGHTEILEMLARRHLPSQKAKADMLFVYQGFRMLLLTRHIPLSRVSTELAAQNNHQSLNTLCCFLKGPCGIPKPRIAVLGVNPHAGEIGGNEETDILLPLLEHLNTEGQAHFEGPFAADAVFRGFDIREIPYDAYVATYHDQGLIPFKLIAGYKAVNVTIGLPFIRTSVGHGTAFDIAGKGLATEESLLEAVTVAAELITRQPIITSR